MKTRTVSFTANYSRTNSNFVIQNLPAVRDISLEYQSLFAVMKNLLQRGAIAELSGGHTGSPTRLSHYLENIIGELAKKENGTERDDFEKSVFLIANKPANWLQTIKGDDTNQYYPAREFFNELPTLLGDYGFVQQLILPETPVYTIYPGAGNAFTHQQVDFYCPPAKLIVEIDGGHHKGIVKVKDDARDEAFNETGVLTVRIDTRDWRERNPAFEETMAQIKNRLIEKASSLRGYKTAYERLTTSGFTDDEIRYKLLPTAIMRFQLLVMELLIGGTISLQDKLWHFVVQDSDGLSQQSELYARFASLAVGDLFVWLAPLCKLMSLPFEQPDLEPIILTNKLAYRSGAIHVDFSLLQRYTDEHLARPKTIYVRTDYFIANKAIDGKNYFRVATTKPINYKLENTDEVRETLEFFLYNLFGNNSFNEGQLPIILNALNQEDTIGLLPTGGGKSLCYQLPCLLQPAISVVICPIKSLMHDQKDDLDRESHITRTNFITGELDADIKEAIQREFADGRYFFIWISPERFQNKSFRNYLSALYARTPLAYAIIDEVHCMSEWGHEFRTSYLNLTKTLHEYCPETRLMGLTATASLNVLRNIQIEFGRGNQDFDSENLKTKLNFSRPELQFEVVDDGGKKEDVLKTILNQLYDQKALIHPEAGKKSGLIFTPNANGEYGCYDQSNELNKLFLGKANWYSGSCPTKTEFIEIAEVDFDNEAIFCSIVSQKLGSRQDANTIKKIFQDRVRLLFTGGRYQRVGYKKLRLKRIPILNDKEFEAHKSKVQKAYKTDEFPLMVATKAFGMGINKRNIYHTFHYGLPGSTESLYQEAGRAGRWNRRQPENMDKQAICRILFSPETLDLETMNALFAPQTTLTQIRTLTDLPNDGAHKPGDALRQLFLFQMGLDTIDGDLEVMQKLSRHILTAPKAPTVNILWKWASREFTGSGEAGEEFFRMLGKRSEDDRKFATEKALYRLSILGIVQNWTTDFVCHFAVSFQVPTDGQIQQNLIAHLIKYKRDDADNTDALVQKIHATEGDNIPEKCMRFLLQWSWDNIAYNRRESLKNVYELCLSFPKAGSESFRQSLDNYFRVDNLTVILQYVADHPRQFSEWEKALQTEGVLVALKPDEWKKRTEQLSRFLEGNQENLGIDVVSGLYRLALGEYDNPAGRARLENTLSRLKTYFTDEEQQQVLQTVVRIAAAINLPTESRYAFADSIERFYPDSYDWMSEPLGILHIPQLTDVQSKLTKLNQKIYDYLLET